MSSLIDTNILVYAANKSCRQHSVAAKFLKEKLSSRDLIFICWPIFYEFLRVVSHPKIMSKPWSLKEASKFLSWFITFSNVQILTEAAEHHETLQEILESSKKITGKIIHDCHIAAIMKDNGVSAIFTHDEDFRRFNFLKVCDPLS